MNMKDRLRNCSTAGFLVIFSCCQKSKTVTELAEVTIWHGPQQSGRFDKLNDRAHGDKNEMSMANTLLSATVLTAVTDD